MLACGLKTGCTAYAWNGDATTYACGLYMAGPYTTGSGHANVKCYILPEGEYEAPTTTKKNKTTTIQNKVTTTTGTTTTSTTTTLPDCKAADEVNCRPTEDSCSRLMSTTTTTGNTSTTTYRWVEPIEEEEGSIVWIGFFTMIVSDPVPLTSCACRFNIMRAALVDSCGSKVALEEVQVPILRAGTARRLSGIARRLAPGPVYGEMRVTFPANHKDPTLAISDFNTTDLAKAIEDRARSQGIDITVTDVTVSGIRRANLVSEEEEDSVLLPVLLGVLAFLVICFIIIALFCYCRGRGKEETVPCLDPEPELQSVAVVEPVAPAEPVKVEPPEDVSEPDDEKCWI
jgi:hypothetical protein